MKLALEIKHELLPLRCSRALLERMFSNLFRPLLRFAAQDKTPNCDSVRVIAAETTRVWGAESMVVEVVCAGFSWADHTLGSLFMPVCVNDDAEDSPDLLAAFFAAHHHGGTIRLKKDRAAGNGFELTLPFSPAEAARPALEGDAVEKLFAELPRWDALERDA